MKVNLSTRVPRCPLCGQFLERIFHSDVNAFVYVCKPDKIGIRCDDPFVGRWEEALAAIPEDERQKCLIHDVAMRFFCTVKGYMQFKCPKKGCGFKAEVTEPDRLTKETPGDSTIGLLEPSPDVEEPRPS